MFAREVTAHWEKALAPALELTKKQNEGVQKLLDDIQKLIDDGKMSESATLHLQKMIQAAPCVPCLVYMH